MKEKSMSETIAVFGSARRNGNTGKLIDLVSERLGINVIDLADKEISPYDYEHKNIDDDFISVMEEVLGHENIIFVSPIYWFAMSAQMKTFIDRMSDFLDVDELKDRGRALRGKTGYVVCTSISLEADQSFLSSFKNTFEYLGLKYGGHVHANCSDGYIAHHYIDDVDYFVQLVKNSMQYESV
jgi:multimeric flavodoxin WrbA